MNYNLYFDAIFKALDVTANVVGNFDCTTYVRSTNDLCGDEPLYHELDTQEELIKNATDIPTEKKLAYLKAISYQRSELRENEIRCKIECAEAIDRGMEKRGQIFTKVFLAILSGGVTLLPDAVSSVGLSIKKAQTEMFTVPDSNSKY
jgi:hypothetical protein